MTLPGLLSEGGRVSRATKAGDLDGGDVAPGVTTQTVTDVPPSSYVVLATCALQEGD